MNSLYGPINFIFCFLFFCLNFVILLLNFPKIFFCDIIIIQNRRVGFGNIFTSIDLSNKLFPKKKILFLLFYEKKKFHNKYIFELLNQNKIIFYFNIVFLKMRMKFGEFEIPKKEKDNFNIFQSFIINIIKTFKKKRMVMNIEQLYQYAFEISKYSKKKTSQLKIPHKSYRWFMHYFDLVKKKKLFPINYNDPLIKKYLLENKKKKTVVIYFREKAFVNSVSQNYKFFLTVINILKAKNFKIFLVGEYLKLIKKFPSITTHVVLPKTDNKYDARLALTYQILSKYFIGHSGGGAWFSMYKKRSVLIGSELCYSRPNVKNYKYEYFYKNKPINKDQKLKKKIIAKCVENENLGLPKFLYKIGCKMKFLNNKKILSYIIKNFN